MSECYQNENQSSCTSAEQQAGCKVHRCGLMHMGTQRGEDQAGWGWVSKEVGTPASCVDNNTNLGAVTTPDDSAACRLMPLFG